jgi:hypothetical protein
MDPVSAVITHARFIAANDPEFQKVKGPGTGNRATNRFMAALDQYVATHFGDECCQQSLCGDTDLSVDFYFRSKGTVVEVALGLPNPNTEFEKDIVKAILAREFRHPVRHLVFISRAGAIHKCSQPGRTAMMAWARKVHSLTIEIHELGGEPRRRVRRRQGRSGDVAG